MNAAAIETAKSNFFATQPQPPQQNAPHPAPASSQHECQQNSISASQPSPASPPPQRQPSDSGPGSPDMLPRPLSRLGSNLKQITGAQLDACKGERIGGGGFGSVYMVGALLFPVRGIDVNHKARCDIWYVAARGL